MNGHILVGYLEQVNPQALAILRQSNPHAKEILSGSMDFGPEDTNSVSTFDRTASLALATVITIELKKDLDALIVSIKKRMHLVRNIRLGGAIISILSGAASAVLALMAKSEQLETEITPVIVAIMTMISGLVSLFADHFERTPTGVKFSGIEELTSLVELRSITEKISLRINQDLVMPCSQGEIISAVDQLNDASLKVIRLKYLSAN